MAGLLRRYGWTNASRRRAFGVALLGGLKLIEHLLGNLVSEPLQGLCMLHCVPGAVEPEVGPE